MAKPIKTLELHYQMIQLLIIYSYYQWNCWTLLLANSLNAWTQISLFITMPAMRGSQQQSYLSLMWPPPILVIMTRRRRWPHKESIPFTPSCSKSNRWFIRIFAAGQSFLQPETEHQQGNNLTVLMLGLHLFQMYSRFLYVTSRIPCYFLLSKIGFYHREGNH